MSRIITIMTEKVRRRRKMREEEGRRGRLQPEVRLLELERERRGVKEEGLEGAEG